MEPSIRNYRELKQYFFEVKNKTELLVNGIMVSARVRREALLSNDQGRIMLNGRVEQIIFKNLLGGVWRASIKK